MGKYLGYVEISEDYNNFLHYNFNLFAEILNDSVENLTEEKLKEILPEAQEYAIELSYKFKDSADKNRMEELFHDNELVVVECETTDLLDSRNKEGKRYKIGYKVNALDMYDMGRIIPIHEEGIYRAVENSEIQSDFYNDPVVDIDISKITSGEKIFVELDDIWAGPYEVGYRVSVKPNSV